MDVPIVPIVIKDIRDLIANYSLIPHSRGTVTVCFGKPFKLPQNISYDRATEEIYIAMKKLSQ